MSEENKIYQRFKNIYSKDPEFKEKVINTIFEPYLNPFDFSQKINKKQNHVDKKEYNDYEKKVESNFQKVIDDLNNKLFKNMYGEQMVMVNDILDHKYNNLKEQTIDQFVINFITSRNEKLFKDIIQWKDDLPNVHNDYHNFKRTIYFDIVDTIFNMEMNGVEKDNKIYSVYSGCGEFKWWNNEYTIYTNGRDSENDEKVCDLGEQLYTIVNIVYNEKTKGMKDIGKPAELVWEGKLVGKELAIDIAIRWDRNVWKSTAHLPEQGKFRGRLVTHAEVYAAVFESTFSAIMEVNDMQGKLENFGGKFLNKNKTTFMDKIVDKFQGKVQDKMVDSIIDEDEKD